MERNPENLSPSPEEACPVSKANLRWPEIGFEWEGYLLLDELGRGAMSRVYLAEETAVANRMVAVKLTPHATREAELQGRLNHEQIVPVYRSRWSRDGQFQIVVMPYRGRATLADVIRYVKQLREQDLVRSDLVATGPGEHERPLLAQVASKAEWMHLDDPSDPSDPSDQDASSSAGVVRVPVKKWEIQQKLDEIDVLLSEYAVSIGEQEAFAELGRGPWTTIDGAPISSTQLVAEVLRVGIDLALALEHAHARGVIHCDLKPANVLVDGLGRVALIDFNLAVDRADMSGPVGGTLPYMPPERLAPISWRHESGLSPERASPEAADLYSLAALMYELLTGELPYGGSDRERPLAEQAVTILSRQLAGATGANSPVQKSLSPLERSVYQLLDTCLDCRADRRLSDLSDFVWRAESILAEALREEASRAWRPRRFKWSARSVGLTAIAGGLALMLMGERFWLDAESRPMISETRVEWTTALRASVGRVRRDFAPHDAESWALVGDGHLYQGESLAAASAYRHARRLGCDRAVVYNNAGLAQSRLGKFAIAEREFTEAIQRDGRLVEAYVNRARSNYDWLSSLLDSPPDSVVQKTQWRALASRLVVQIRRDEAKVLELGGVPPLPKSWEPVKLAGLRISRTGHARSDS